ncbi:MAG: low molecular weight phosphotyrosine protein phosphatase [Bacteroidetes bacterium]|nr:low molecular weight phosphotyrosine protein phosphatase [Bacteroidota bacterium]
MKAKILFVCLGNICRSPSAEAVFKMKLIDHGLDTEVEVDSAGTSSYHEREPADSRMKSHAIKRGYELTSISRQIFPSDFDYYDLIIAMDDNNYHNLIGMAKNPSHKNKIALMTEFSKNHEGNIPDPYHGGSQGFEAVLDILEDSSEGLITEIKESYF